MAAVQVTTWKSWRGGINAKAQMTSSGAAWHQCEVGQTSAADDFLGLAPLCKRSDGHAVSEFVGSQGVVMHRREEADGFFGPEICYAWPEWVLPFFKGACFSAV